MEELRSFGGQDKRKTPRLKTICDVSLVGDASMLDMEAGGEAGPDKLTLFGSTRDLNESGLSLILPAFLLDENFCTDEDSKLRVRIELPTTTVNLHAAPVHCKPLNQKDPKDGSIVGVRIVEMDEENRQQYLKYLRQSH